MKTNNRKTLKNRIIIWGGWYGSHNVGDRLLLLTITDILASHFHSVEITVLTDSAEQIHRYIDPISHFQFHVLESKKQLAQVISSLAKGHLFILGGGVPFFQTPKQILVMSFLTILCRIFDTPYGAWCVASQPLTSPLAKRIFAWILNGAAFITTRDDFTTLLFQKMGVRTPIEKVADSTFTFHLPQTNINLNDYRVASERIEHLPLLALSPRTLSGSDNRKQIHYRFQSKQQYQQELDCFAGILDWGWENGYQPIFIPMNTFGDDDDRLAANSIIKQSRFGKFALLVNQEIPPQDSVLLYRLCQASFVARVHGSVTSALANTPVMMYAFQPKHVGIMQSMGLEAYVINSERCKPNNAILLMEKLLHNRTSIQREMQSRLNDLQISALRPVQLISQYLTLKERI